MVQTQNEASAQVALLVTFYVGNTLCAVDAATVQEIIRVQSITPAPHAPHGVAGLMNLRGKVITLLDLGLILGFPKVGLTRETRVLIVEDRNEVMGLLVDKVGEVIEAGDGQQEPLPANIPATEKIFFQGIRRANGQVVAILNVPVVLDEGRLQ